MPISTQSSSSGGRAAEDLDRLAVSRQRHDRALRVLALAEPGAGALALALPVDGVDADDLHAEDLLHGDLDLGLVRTRRHQEGVLVLLEQPVGLLGDHGREQDVPVVGDHLEPSSSTTAAEASAEPEPCWDLLARNTSSESLVNTTSSLTSTS